MHILLFYHICTITQKCFASKQMICKNDQRHQPVYYIQTYTYFEFSLSLHYFFLYFIHTSTGTESEISFSLLNGGRGGTNRCNGLDTSTASTRILMSPGSKAVKIAAISGKPRVQRYLSRECEFAFIFTHM